MRRSMSSGRRKRPKLKDQIVALRKQGLTYQQIQDATGASSAWVYVTLRDAGMTVPQGYEEVEVEEEIEDGIEES